MPPASRHSPSGSPPSPPPSTGWGWIPVERHENDPQDLKDGYFASIPMQRWGKPEDLAGTIVYLASEASAFVTGQNIHVNGGVTVH